MNRKVNVGIGMTSIIMIIVSFCLTVFAIEGVVTANENKKINDRRCEYVREYYKADSEATIILSRIRSALESPVTDATNMVQSVCMADDRIIVNKNESGYCVRYDVDINASSYLYVEVYIDEVSREYSIQKWKTRVKDDLHEEESLNLWDGSF